MRSSVPACFESVAVLAALFSVLLVAPVFGQEAVEPEETAVAAEPDTAIEPADDEAVAPAVAEAGTVLDYEPTESISEDLSDNYYGVGRGLRSDDFRLPRDLSTSPSYTWQSRCAKTQHCAKSTACIASIGERLVPCAVAFEQSHR